MSPTFSTVVCFCRDPSRAGWTHTDIACWNTAAMQVWFS